MNIEDVYKLIERIENSNLSEFELEMNDVKLSLKKNIVVKESQVASVITQTEAATDEVVKADLTRKDCIEVKAPFVGTFYRAPSPEEKPFVMIGTEVKKGEIVGIIEAMKLMNEITAPEDGVVEEILVEDGELVDFDKTMIIIKKN